jgi:hypothetical protein
MSNPLGVLIASLASPRIVQHCSHVPLLNIYTAVPSIILTIVATFAIRKSEPPIPPTVSAGQEYFEFKKGITFLVSHFLKYNNLFARHASLLHQQTIYDSFLRYGRWNWNVQLPVHRHATGRLIKIILLKLVGF